MTAFGIRVAAAVALLAVFFAVDASSPQALRKQMELSMVVTGLIDIDADGRVAHYALDKPEKLPSEIVQLVSMKLPNWKFATKTIDGKPVGAHAKVALRFVASPKGGGDYDIGIRTASFFDDADKENRISVGKRTSIGTLVTALMMSGATGDVYIALKIGPDGRVMDGIVEQVNLTATGTDAQMAHARKLLGERSLAVLRDWTFIVPASGEGASKPYWSGVMPLVFRMRNGQPEDGNYGKWHAYLPGPRANIPWRNPEDEKNAGGIDALPAGLFSLDGVGPKLLTPLMQG
ncbi:protein tonB [Pseudoluteimonas lycopersici]|uniref:Protein tonB n=1 Tax=Pseudoluteimonas lycopersici TaxID=1324796 RepID=A0A516V6U1_9GAMM|nr:protein tonB [Lysobacter lycopersici]QDQ74223.1 protein tonB [Lysobacter lycopersici]